MMKRWRAGPTTCKVMKDSVTCPRCKGTGAKESLNFIRKCKMCNGKGRVPLPPPKVETEKDEKAAYVGRDRGRDNAGERRGQGGFTMRTIACRVFRAFSKGEDPSMVDELLAVKYLSRQTGHDEDKAMTFLGDRYTWFRNKERTFSMKGDEDVIAMTIYRFKRWMEDERKRKEPKEGQPWRAEELPENFDVSEKDAVDYGDLKHASQEEISDDTRSTKETDFAKFVQRLKERQDKEGKLYENLIRATLRENAKHSPEDLALDRTLREQAMMRNPRIQSLTFKKTHRDKK